jgi:uncharacterized membrane protein YvbJ
MMYTDYIVGGILLCVLIWMLSRFKRNDSSVDRFQEEIINSDKYKVKGKFEQ